MRFQWAVVEPDLQEVAQDLQEAPAYSAVDYPLQADRLRRNCRPTRRRMLSRATPG